MLAGQSEDEEGVRAEICASGGRLSGGLLVLGSC